MNTHTHGKTVVSFINKCRGWRIFLNKSMNTAAAAANIFRPAYYVISSLFGLSIPSCLIHKFIDVAALKFVVHCVSLRIICMMGKTKPPKHVLVI